MKTAFQLCETQNKFFRKSSKRRMPRPGRPLDICGHGIAVLPCGHSHTNTPLFAPRLCHGWGLSLFSRRLEILFPSIHLIPLRCFRVRNTLWSLARLPLSCRPVGLLGEGEVWGLPEQGRAAYTPYECSAPSTSRLERGHAFSSFAALSGNCFCPGILLRRGSISSAVSIFPHDWDSCHACPRSPPAA